MLKHYQKWLNETLLLKMLPLMLPLKKLSFCLSAVLACVLLLGYEKSYADTVVRLPLEHRSAVDVQAVISPLLSKDGAITADGRAVLLRAPDTEAKRLIKIIRAMDKPRALLSVSVFRGKHPDKKGVKVSSTASTNNSGANRLHTIRVEDGQTLVVGETQVVKIPVATTQYANNIDVDNAGVDPDESSAVSIVVDDGVIASNGVNSSREALEDGQDGINALAIQNAGGRSGEALTQQQYALQQVLSGMHLRLTTVDKQKVRVHLKVVTPQTSDTQGTSTVGKSSNIQAINLSQSVETMSVIPLDQWTKLSENQVFSHRAVLDHSRKTYSTQSTADSEKSIWIKVEKHVFAD